MAYPHVSVEGTTVADDRAVSPEITVTRQFSADAPALVRIELTNESNNPIGVTMAYIIPFDAMRGHLTDGTARIYLLPRDQTSLPPGQREGYEIPAEPIEGCWRVSEPPFIREAATSWFAEPGDSMQREHAVLEESDSESCLQPGTYQFAVSWREQPLDDLRDESSELRYQPTGDETAYSWEFTVTLHE